MLIPDNLKSAIIKANRYEPTVNRALEDFANHYNTTVVPARSRKPKDKALVENQVRLIYNRVYAKLRNQQFFDLHTLNQAIKDKNMDHNQTRMQLRSYCREEHFLSKEKHLLQPLPQTSFELKHYREYKVAQNNHIFLGQDKHYYSVPYTYIGQKAKVIYTHTMVRIYINGKQVATHIRDYRNGKYSTEEEHLCSTHKHYLNRSPGYYMEKAKMKKVLGSTLNGVGLAASQVGIPESVVVIKPVKEYKTGDVITFGDTSNKKAPTSCVGVGAIADRGSTLEVGHE